MQLLIDAINKNYKEEHYCQFASHLLIMTLGFLTRMIKSQTLLEEHTAEILAGPDIPREGIFWSFAHNTHLHMCMKVQKANSKLKGNPVLAYVPIFSCKRQSM